jgi:hypothetical protein
MLLGLIFVNSRKADYVNSAYHVTSGWLSLERLPKLKFPKVSACAIQRTSIRLLG